MSHNQHNTSQSPRTNHDDTYILAQKLRQKLLIYKQLVLEQLTNQEAFQSQIRRENRAQRSSIPTKYLDIYMRNGSRKRSAAEALLLRDASISNTRPLLTANITDIEDKLKKVARQSRHLHSLQKRSRKSQYVPKWRLPIRTRSHWDNLLQEMAHMAIDFAEERKWKRSAQLYLAQDIAKNLNEERMRQELFHCHVARNIARYISVFWNAMERVAIRSRIRLEGAKCAMDPAKTAIQKEIYINSHFQMPKQIPLSPSHSKANESLCALLNLSINARKGSFPALDPIFQRFQAQSNPALCNFQLTALRFMLHFIVHRQNIFLNDQIGMRTASTIAAFLHILTLYNDSNNGPHLLIVADDQVHKWCFHMRSWHFRRKIQMYEGSPLHVLRFQRAWHAETRGDLAYYTPDDLFLDDDAIAKPLFCCICPVSMFLRDRDSFQAFPHWQMVIVEKECKAFEDSACVQALSSLRQQANRIVCSSQALQQFKSIDLSLQYAQFLVQPELHCLQPLHIERSFVFSVFSQLGCLEKPDSKDMNALLFALYCLRLRRVRSQVQLELFSIQEQSVPCTLSHSQNQTYRNVLAEFIHSELSAPNLLLSWLKLFLTLRNICNGAFDPQKTSYSDAFSLENAFCKLHSLRHLLTRLVQQEDKRVIVYYQLSSVSSLLETYFSLLKISYVHVVGNRQMQHRILRHFAIQPAIQVILAPTRLANMDRARAMPIYGADAVIVFDSDWNALSDAKLRASWATLDAMDLVVYRMHCEQTIESALMPYGSVLLPKFFIENLAHQIVALPQELTVRWGSQDQSLYLTEEMLASAMDKAEKSTSIESDALEAPLDLAHGELDAEEHLLLSRTDKLLPIEWYAVHCIHSIPRSDSRAHTLHRSLHCASKSEESHAKTELFYLNPQILTRLKNQNFSIDFSMHTPFSSALRIHNEPGKPARFHIQYFNAHIESYAEPNRKIPRLKKHRLKKKSKLSELEDDAFWGDTNLDALDSASWDDPALSRLFDAPLTSADDGKEEKRQIMKKQRLGHVARSRKNACTQRIMDAMWSHVEDQLLCALYALYGGNWTLLSDALHAMTAVSRFRYEQKSARQCFDRFTRLNMKEQKSLASAENESERLMSDFARGPSDSLRKSDSARKSDSIRTKTGNAKSALRDSFKAIVQSKEPILESESLIAPLHVKAIHKSHAEIAEELMDMELPVRVIQYKRSNHTLVPGRVRTAEISPLSSNGDAILGAAFGARRQKSKSEGMWGRAGESAPLHMHTESLRNRESDGRGESMLVSASTLVYVLDRMPEIKDQIQNILNQKNCSETKKVAMIAEILSLYHGMNGNREEKGMNATMQSIMREDGRDGSDQ